MSYLSIIKYAIVFFPVIALLFTMPFILSQYHRYGSISLFKSTIIYAFIFYLLCAYFLVILPLPKISEVAKMTSPRTQLIPFSFIIDFVTHTSLNVADPHTYLSALKESYVYVPLFNILLTLPFGVFLRYLFQCDWKKTMILSFLLSLFFELTQLSGLYFIYPRGYRLFDVDDLMLNTCGGLLGYFLCRPIISLIPPIHKINAHTKEKGKSVSGFRRTLAFFLDVIILLIIQLMSIISFGDHYQLSLSIAIIYYFVVPLFLNTSTLGEKFLNIQVLDDHHQKNLPRLLYRKIIFCLIYIGLPMLLLSIVSAIPDEYQRELAALLMMVFLLMMYAFSLIKYLFTTKQMLYEKISKTELVSTIK